eukprot:scaffold54604_cov73-Cyclotella_meneghiniana.AAC.7
MKLSKEAGEGFHVSADMVVSASTDAWNEAVAAGFHAPLQVGSLEGVSQGAVLSPLNSQVVREGISGSCAVPWDPGYWARYSRGGGGLFRGGEGYKIRFSGRLHEPQGVMVHPDLTGDKFYAGVEITELMDCRIGGDDMHGKYGFAGFRGIPNGSSGSSPAYQAHIWRIIIFAVLWTLVNVLTFFLGNT